MSENKRPQCSWITIAILGLLAGLSPAAALLAQTTGASSKAEQPAVTPEEGVEMIVPGKGISEALPEGDAEILVEDAPPAPDEDALPPPATPAETDETEPGLTTTGEPSEFDARLVCFCGLDTSGEDFCFTSGTCAPACNSNDDCGPGTRCLMSNCCGFNVCAPDCLQGCVGGRTCATGYQLCSGPGEDCNGNGISDATDIATGNSQDCQPNGVPDDCDLDNPAPSSYGASPNLAIPDNNLAGVSSVINVPDHGVITDLNVGLHINHTWQGDLVVTLSHRDVTRTLINRVGLCADPNFGYAADNFGAAGTPLILDDAAATGIDCYSGSGSGGTNNYAGPARPDQLLAAFNGLDPAGSWTLNVSDRSGLDLGTLVTWQLDLETTSSDCNANAAPDECELADNDCNANGVPDECDVDVPVIDGFSLSPNLPVPDNNTTGVSSTLTLPVGGTIQDVNVHITISHTWVGDLEISLTHGGATVLLFNRQCGDVDNFSDTVFDDEAAGAIACVAGNVGVFRPFSPLSAFDGLDLAGDWTLHVRDLVGDDLGTLVSWRLVVQTISEDCNENGTPDECDLDNPAPSSHSASPNLAIPDNNTAGVNSVINVPDQGVTTDVDVALHINHTWQGDLVVTLSHADVTATLINRAGIPCAFNPSFGYSADNFGSAGSPLLLDDSAAVAIDCYAGAGSLGFLDYAGPARPNQPLSAFNGLDPAGDWILDVSDFAGGDLGTLVTWRLDLESAWADCNTNGIPDECDGGCPPAATVTGAVSRKTNPAGPGGFCDLSLQPPVRSEPRVGGITEVRVAFDVTPGELGPSPVTIEEATCAAPAYVPYTGASTASASVAGNELVLTFSPALENARTYRLALGPGVSSIPGQFVEVAGLIGDANHNGFVNGNDRSVVIGVWTAPGGFSCDTDLNSSGSTNGNDRSIVIGAWTGTGTTCAP